jgi:hypothetical protein
MARSVRAEAIVARISAVRVGVESFTFGVRACRKKNSPGNTNSRCRSHPLTWLDEFFAAWDVEGVAGLHSKEEIILEYTDAPSIESETETTGTMPCPVCGHILPKEAERCDRCNWTRQGKAETAEGKASDAVAVMLSVIPGLGHVYKGYKLVGLLFVTGAIGAIALGALAATATAGFGLFLIPIYWFAVMFHVYAIQDRIAPTTQDEGEEY